MTRSLAVAPLGSEFDDFLFAPIGDDGNGMPLSVLSALARLDIDPWHEASKLAQLPAAAAIERLTSLIAALPEGPSLPREPAIAARLIALLQRRVGSNIVARGGLPGTGGVTGSQSVIRLIVINVIFVAFMLTAQWIVAIHQPMAQTESAHPEQAGTASAQMPPPNSRLR